MKKYLKKSNCIVCSNLLFFRLLGLAPFGVILSDLLRSNEKLYHNEKIFFVSTVGYLYNCVLIGTIIWTFSKVGTHFLDIEILGLPSLPKMIRKYMCSSSYALVIIIWILCIIRQKKLVELANRMFKLHRLITRCNSVTLKHGNHMIIKLVLYFLCMISLILSERLTGRVEWLEVAFFLAPLTVISETLAQYSFILDHIGDMITSLNNALLRIGRIPEESKLSTLLTFSLRKIPIADNALIEIGRIRQIHEELCDACYEFGEIYAPLILIAVPACIGWSVYSLYFIIAPFITQNDEKYDPRNGIGLGWVAMETCGVIYLCISGAGVTRAIKRTTNAIHKVLDYCILHPNVANELERFSQDLLIRKFQLTVYGMFTLDNSLLTSIAATIVTYVVILIQFLIN